MRCTEEILDDGSTLWLIHRPTFTDGRQPDLLEAWATLERPDGLSIELRQNNAVGEKDVPATRPQPPLTSEQMEAIVTSDQWDTFEVDPDVQNEVKEVRDRIAAASRRLADALGSGWTPPDVARFGYRPEVVPTPENAADLPAGYAYVLMSRDVIPGDPAFLDQVCRGMTEKGRESGSCDESTTPTGEPVYLRWSHSVDHSQSVPHDELWVMSENDSREVVRVMLSVSDDPELSTPARRTEIVAWIEQQIDAMVAVATAEDAAAG